MNEWDTGLQGEIVITNTSEGPLEAWELSFDSTFAINNLWDGKIISGNDGHYVVASEMWSNPISAGESKTIGFIGVKNNDDEPTIGNYSLSVVVIDGEGSNDGTGEGDDNDDPTPDPDIDLTTDTDGDGLPDTYETFFGTDPNKIDTDGDGLTDLEEIGLTKTDPLVYNSVNPSLSDEMADSDGDGLTNREELIIGTDSTQKDTDGDEIDDFNEINIWNTDPLVDDTDGDGITDGDETKIGLDPTNPKTFGYPDIEYKSNQHISEDSISLSSINNEDNDVFTYSVDITSNGYVEPYITARESVYTNVMKNDFMIGIAPELIYHGMYDIDSVKVSFKISDSFIENNKEADESNIEFLHGINIFRYYESANALLPVATYFDNENNTVYTESDAITTYCLMDMDSWVEMMERYAPKEKITLKKSVRGFNELNTLIGTNNEDDYRMEVSETQEDSFISVAPKFSVMSQSSLIASNEVKSVVETDEKTEDVIDVVFVIQSAGTDRSYFLSEIETIENVSKMLFNYSSRVRISIIDYKLKSSIPSVEWYDSFSDVQYRLSKLRYSYSNENDYCDRGAAFNAINKYANFIKNAGKFVMHFVNGRTTSNTLIDHINLCKENNINVSEFNPYGWYYISSSYGEKVKNTITSTGGLYKTFDYIKPEQLFNHIINNLADPQDDFVGLVPTGWKELVLSAPLEQDSLTDTDDDGKTDWNEVDNKLLSWDSTGKIKPISYEVYCKIVDPFGYSKFIDAYKYSTEHWKDTPIIPLVSDPTNPDSDEDGLGDKFDAKPFEKFDERFIIVDDFNYYPDIDFMKYEKLGTGDTYFNYGTVGKDGRDYCYNTKSPNAADYYYYYVALLAANGGMAPPFITNFAGLLSGNGFVEMYHSGAFFSNFLENTGKKYVLTSSEMKELILTGKNNLYHYQYNVNTLLDLCESTVNDGETVIFSSNSDDNFKISCYNNTHCHFGNHIFDATAITTDVGKDWSFSIGEAFGGMVCKVTRNGDVYTAQYRYCLLDYYEWGYHAEGNDYKLHRLHETGLAREYPIYGELVSTITWEKGYRLTSVDDINAILNG